MKLEIHNKDYSVRLKLLNVQPEEITLEYTCTYINDAVRGLILTYDGPAEYYYAHLYYEYIGIRSVSIQELRGHDYSWVEGLGGVEDFVLFLPGKDNDKPRTMVRTFHGTENANRKIIEIFVKYNVLSKIKLL